MITNRNYNKGRRFLNPLEVEAQYHTEDRATNPDLLLWIDFTDPTSLKSLSSGGVDDVTDGDAIMIAQNKSYFADGANAGMVSAGDKALSTGVFQTSSSNCPTFVDPGDGTPPYATFDGGDFMQAVNTLGRVSSSNFSTSEIDVSQFTMYIVCQRTNPASAQQQDVLFVTTNDHSNDTPNQFINGFFNNANKLHVRLTGSGQSGMTRYDVADDGNFHYHMFNAYELYSQATNYTSLQADGLFHQFSEDASDKPSPLYERVWNPGFSISPGVSGSINETFQFTGTPGTYHPSVTIGGQPQLGSTAAKGTFAGRIYEVLIFKSEHAGPNQLDEQFFGATFKRRWSNMLYYLQRKYQYISVKI